eukprot:SAG11_NODE_10281_length_842_cov_0.947510_2_plen_41_part_01
MWEAGSAALKALVRGREAGVRLNFTNETTKRHQYESPGIPN